MLDFIKEEKNCTACGVCVNICPRHCISLKEDENGFLFPIKDESSCNNCGLCKIMCPINSGMTKRQFKFTEQRYFAFCLENEMEWKASTSGGAFSAICNAVIEKYGKENVLFAGVAMEKMQVKHVLDTNFKIFRKSKYVQSDMGNIYSGMEDALKIGKIVVFSGTPCQVAGVSAYFSRKKYKPILIDFVCHGVGSPGVFKDYIDGLSGNRGKVLNYSFREKEYRNGNLIEYLSKITYEKGGSKCVDRDVYVQAFLNQKINRESCLQNCVFRNEDRLSDFTLGDFRNVQKVIGKNIKFPERNYSMITMNSPLALELGKYINRQGDLIECSLENIVTMNPLFIKHADSPNDRDAFFQLRKKHGSYRALKKVRTIHFYSISKWSKYVSPKLKQKLKKCFWGNRREI